jgi:hypothetical protein
MMPIAGGGGKRDLQARSEYSPGARPPAQSMAAGAPGTAGGRDFDHWLDGVRGSPRRSHRGCGWRHGKRNLRGASAAASARTIHIEQGFRVELVAAEPLVADPVSIAWDAAGRMWLAEMADYPTGGPAGRIRRLEDSDGDGFPDRASIFVAGLAYPTSVLPLRGGILVAAAPDIPFPRRPRRRRRRR